MDADPNILLEEIDNQMRRLTTAAVVDYKKELLANNYPIMRMLAELVVVQSARIDEVNARLDLAEGAIAEALTHMDSQILPELAAQIQMTLALGLQVGKLTTELKFWAEPKMPNMPDELRATIHAFEQAAKQVSDEVGAVTLEAIDDDELEQMESEEDAESPQPDPAPADPPPTEGDDESVVDQALQGKENSQ